MVTRIDQIEGGLWGLLTGDASGVPYEFREPWELPPKELLGPRPPDSFTRSYRDVPLGTWSDDGAQALALFAALLETPRTLDLRLFVRHLLDWRNRGAFAVDGRVFDIGIQTGEALRRLGCGVSPETAGLAGERNNGNGSLMRVLPVALLHEGADAELVEWAHQQSRPTHRHPRSLMCCALYALWARCEMEGEAEPWSVAIERLRAIYAGEPDFLTELEALVAMKEPRVWGSGYCVDCLLSARRACEKKEYAAIVIEAIGFGRDTDTTAAVAGGIAGIRYGKEGIPEEWRKLLRGREILDPLLAKVRSGGAGL